MSSAPSDLGPVLPSPAAVWDAAKQIEHHAELAKRYSSQGPMRDLPRALKQFEAIRALLPQIGSDGGARP